LLGRYVLQELLGNGSTSLIFRSFHEALGVPVALKVFRPIDAVVDPGARERFVREARMLARLDHPNIVRVLDVDETQGVPFIVFEFVGAMSLDELVRAMGCLSNARALQLAHELASALRAAHLQGLIHRDVKPANVLVRKDGVVKLVDFGLAQSAAELANATEELISGTPSFMAPEAIVSPNAVDEGADMYSLGCTLFSALTGRAPFERSNPAQTMRAQVEDPPPPVSGLRVDVHPGLEAVVMRLLAKDRGDRYATWDELIAVLDALGLERTVAKPLGGRRGWEEEVASRAAESSLSTVSATVSHLFRKGAR
jgi:serine/threonine protein kinase